MIGFLQLHVCFTMDNFNLVCFRWCSIELFVFFSGSDSNQGCGTGFCQVVPWTKVPEAGAHGGWILSMNPDLILDQYEKGVLFGNLSTQRWQLFLIHTKAFYVLLVLCPLVQVVKLLIDISLFNNKIYVRVWWSLLYNLNTFISMGESLSIWKGMFS